MFIVKIESLMMMTYWDVDWSIRS